VLAFEPHPEIGRRLRDNVAGFSGRRPVAAVEVSAKALGDRIGSCFLDVGDDFASNQGTAHATDREGPLRVEMTTLDAVLGGGAARVVKIDVEGGEPQVLAGAAGALAAGRIANVVYEAYAPLRQPLAELLRGHGYEVVALGWALRGLVLSAASEAPRLPPYEPPNFLATREPERVLPLLRLPGWRVLRAGRSRRATVGAVGERRAPGAPGRPGAPVC
jgi:FkbM family methyltransferase